MNKRILTLFICLAVVVLTVVISAVTFTVRDIKVLLPISQEDSFDKAKIVSDSMIKIGSSIFSLSEKNAINNIEIANPYAKVVTIERVFPSTIHINLLRRSAIMSLGVVDGGEVYIDREIKLLEYRPKLGTDNSSIIRVTGFKLSSIKPESVGMSLTIEGDIDIIHKTIMACENVGLVNEFVTVFAREFDMSNPKYLVIKTHKGLNIALRRDVNIDFAAQFRSLFSEFESSGYREDSSKFLYLSQNGITIVDKLP